MTLSLTSAHGWRISTQARGEVLTAAARAGGCQFVVLGVPGGQPVPEVEAWLGDLLGVATEGSSSDHVARPIPALLYHALTGLLFSHREVWNAGPEDSTLSLAFVHTGEEIAFGWVGLGEPDVWIDDRPADVQWVRVRDHQGREAYALAAGAGVKVRVSLEWTPSSAGPGAPGVRLDAEWGGVEAGSIPAAEAGSVAVAGLEAGAEPEAAPFTIAEVLGAADATAVAPGPRVVEVAPVPPGHAMDPVSYAAAGRTPPAFPGVAIPELIPPTPEPADLTARALQSQAAGRAGADAPAAAPPASHPAPVAPPAARPVSSPAEPAWVEPPAPTVPRPRPRMRPAWPTEQELSHSRRRGARPWMWVVGALALVVVAWFLGLVPGVSRPGSKGPGLPFLGLGGARFQVRVDSRPPGAWIAADGKDLAQRTPATIDLPAGEHEIALSFPDMGSAAFTIRGARGDRQVFSAPLWGTLSIRDADANVPIAVDLDGNRIGYAPLTLDSLAPGPHEVRFSGPGLTPWGQALRVRIGEVTEVIARPMTTPAHGVLEVRATFTDGNGTNTLEGATVWVDGERRGVTPLVLELARGPHSARVEYRGERTPIQVIDLPGGNQRFASFELGLNLDVPELEPGPLPSPVPLSRPTVVSASLDGAGPGDVREMWLHVREPDGLWRRVQMMMLKAPGGVVGVALFPTALFDSRGTTRYYMSAATQTGDEYFTDIFTARSASRQVSAP